MYNNDNIQGQIERVTYTNDDSGFTVAKVKVDGSKHLVTVVGSIMSPAPGQIMELTGTWNAHPKYGRQFKVEKYKTKVPASVVGIEKYLGSGLIKGIGPVMAKRIVRIFKEKSLDIIETEPQRLTEVEGIGKKRIDMISQAWDDQKEIREVMVFLQSHGVSCGYATKIFKTYGKQSIDVVQKNPYVLASDIYGIGFLTADKIAQNLGFSKDCNLRAEAGILYVLNKMADDGHVYYPYESLIEKCNEILEVERNIIVNAFASVANGQKIVIEDINNEEYLENNKAVYLKPFYVSETNISNRLKMLLQVPCQRKFDEDEALDIAQKSLSVELAKMQVEAVLNAINSKVMILTGGPGTGKTTIIKALLKIFSSENVDILLAAPTGRAAKRMSETTGYPSKTIHRLLEFSPKNGKFEKDDKDPLNCGLLIIDEASMIDTLLMHHLLKAIPVTASFILVGDINQLPSVGPGNILRDIINSGIVNVVKLNEIFRQAKESLIITNAHKINEGFLPSLKNPPKNSSDDELLDFYFIEQGEPEKVLELILNITKNRIPERFKFNPIDDVQILSPMHKGFIGAGNLNVELQKCLNPRKDGIVKGGQTFCIGDKVMQIKNNYHLEVFNGDIGRIVKIDLENKELSVAFGERVVKYDSTALDEITLAYAISVHKAQGSEYPAIVMPILIQHYPLLERNLIYTGITRGKKLVVLIGTKKAFTIAVKNNKTKKRYTYLMERLRFA